MGVKTCSQLLENIRANVDEPIDDLTSPSAGTLFTNTFLLSCLNKGKDREQVIIRKVRENFFQIAAATPLSLVVTTKEYALESDTRQLVGMRCTTAGYEGLRFRFVDQSAREFQDQDALPASESGDTGELIYDIIAQAKVKFARFPPAVLTVQYDYIEILDDYTLGTSTSNLPDETAEFREAYATWKALGKMPSDKRLPYWKSEVDRLEAIVIDAVANRNIRDSEHVEPF